MTSHPLPVPAARDWADGTSLAVEGLPQRLVRFVLGYEPIREDVSIAGGDPYRILLEPVTAAAVVYERGWVLLDSGFNVDTIRDPEARAAHYNWDSYTAIITPGDALRDQVAAAGLDWAELAGCAISHVHIDHTGGLRLLADGPPVLFQRAEWTFASTVAGLEHFAATDDFLRDGLDIVLLDGDTVLAPGLTALDTRGHTPGHQSFRVDLAEGSIVLACDAADLRANITESTPCGSTALPEGAADAQASIDRLHALDAEPGVEVWPGHDPDWWAWQNFRDQWA
ncbi:N-acyl homoserine lactonase family protein [Cryobacterium sp. SO2]|uniref:N-acyl homoserine lactonase family protein n=1 Tax=Cryobacterium sp. SO2 TaxID=1897060 RepID=UPI00223D17C0|nr:N-acyl homoserine lactonase family protein [Cryobacterium sp. SO2]WEO75804.1 N-acyl homoserine lactonase family protein [Cryobacterium sp. SO2]